MINHSKIKWKINFNLKTKQHYVIYNTNKSNKNKTKNNIVTNLNIFFHVQCEAFIKA